MIRLSGRRRHSRIPLLRPQGCRRAARLHADLTQRGADIPLHLETKNYRDLTSIELLIDDIHAGKGVELKPEFRETYVTAPEKPSPISSAPKRGLLSATR